MILNHPKDTDELTKYIKFLDDAKINILPGLKDQTSEVFLCEIVLFEFKKLTTANLKPFDNTLKLVKYVYEVLLGSKRTIEMKSSEFKSKLTGRIRQFNTELENCKSKLDELPKLGNINDINEYAKKTQMLHDRLTNALKTIDEINRLEKYYGLPESVYYQRKPVNNRRKNQTLNIHNR